MSKQQHLSGCFDAILCSSHKLLIYDNYSCRGREKNTRNERKTIMFERNCYGKKVINTNCCK